MWVMGLWLFLCFCFAPDQYREYVAAGEPCYVYVASLGDGSAAPAQPSCWYDPTNTNVDLAAR